MPTIPLQTAEQDIFSYGFGSTLLRTPAQQLDATPSGGSIQSVVDPVDIEYGRTIGGWTIGNDRLYNKNIVIDAAIGRITVGGAGGIVIDDQTKKITVGASNIVIDAANKYILINDGTNDRVLIGYDAGGF